MRDTMSCAVRFTKSVSLRRSTMAMRGTVVTNESAPNTWPSAFCSGTATAAAFCGQVTAGGREHVVDRTARQPWQRALKLLVGVFTLGALAQPLDDAAAVLHADPDAQTIADMGHPLPTTQAEASSIGSVATAAEASSRPTAWVHRSPET